MHRSLEQLVLSQIENARVGLDLSDDTILNSTSNDTKQLAAPMRTETYELEYGNGYGRPLFVRRTYNVVSS